MPFALIERAALTPLTVPELAVRKEVPSANGSFDLVVELALNRHWPAKPRRGECEEPLPFVLSAGETLLVLALDGV